MSDNKFLSENKTKKYKKINLYITGYGPFMKIKLNPSQLLVDSITKIVPMIDDLFNKKICISQIEIMEVSVEYVGKKLKEIHEIMYKNKEENEMNMIINFGVYDALQEAKLHLESIAHNWINDHNSINNNIVNEDIKDLNTKLDLESLIKKLSSSCKISYDAGYYLCNFAFFTNLYAFKDKGDFYSEFIHIPNIDVMPTEVALNKFIEFLMCLVEEYTE